MYKVIRRSVKFQGREVKAGDVLTQEDINEIPEKIRERRLKTLENIGTIEYIPDVENICIAMTEKGTRCTRSAKGDSLYCGIKSHQEQMNILLGKKEGD